MTVVSPHPAPSLRADAERNRQKILEVAARVFAERGIDATLNDIAHAAGVGVGTVYRKFSDKNALIQELIDEKLNGVLARVDAASAHESGGAALREGMREAAAMRARDRGLFGILFSAGRPTDARDHGVNRLLHAWDDVIARAQAEGAVRPGFSSADIDYFMLMIGAVADATHDIEPLAWERCVEVLLDGYFVDGPRAELADLALPDASRRAIFLTS